MHYVFKYKRGIGLLWLTLKAKGHNYIHEMDRMEVMLADGGIFSIAKWSECTLKLGLDWEVLIKAQMEKEAGQPIPTHS